ncbi:MAG: hypothetical protein OEL89_00250 [Candidatus Peregrinibacteria bacterium]|nr:hypothetical protein [Candidatus Peregrinibacteria bacterium]
MDEFEIKYFKQLSERVYFKSHYNFTNTINGFNKGKTHVFMATEGAGKTTWVKSVLFDTIAANQGVRILIWLSEESIDDFKTDLAIADVRSDKLKNVFIVSEQDFDFNTPKKVLDSMENFIKELDVDIVFFDNITTSECYLYENGRYEAESSKRVKKIAKRANIAMIIIAHADSLSSKNRSVLMESSNIRGNKTMSNLAEYFYILQYSMINNVRVTFLRLTKHRPNKNVENYFFRLFYNPKTGIFDSDSIISFEEMKEFLNRGNKL